MSVSKLFKDSIGWVAAGGPQVAGLPAYSTDSSGNVIGLVEPGGNTVNLSSLYQKLLSARQEAANLNPFDLQGVSSQPLVSSVTIPSSTSSFSNPKTVVYSSTTVDEIRLDGVPYLDGTYGYQAVAGTPGGNLTGNIGSGQFYTTNYNGNPGSGFAGMTPQQNYLTNFIMRARVMIGSGNTNKCVIWTGVTNISSDYFPMWVNGIPVAPTTASVTNNMLQINFAAAGTYDLAIGVQQSLGVGGVIVDQDDCVIPLTKTRIPIVWMGDSYTQGVAKTPSNTQAYGELTLCSAIGWICGLNVIPQGFTSTGIVNDGSGHLPSAYTSTSFNYGQSNRMQLTAALVNASKARLIVIQGSYNDASLSGITSAIAQTQCASIISYLLSATSANIVVTGVFPGALNLSAGCLAAENGYAAAVTAANNGRVAFLPVCTASPAWIFGGKNNSGGGSGAGPSRYYTGGDGVHPSGLLTANQNAPANTVFNSGLDYMARKILDGITRIALANNW